MTPAILLPGSILPAGPAYAALISELGGGRDVRAKDLEVYTGDTPPADFSLTTEVDGVLRLADGAGFDRFHVVGYSAGGAVATTLAATHPTRVRSLGLMEPAWVGNQGLSAAETAARRSIGEALAIEDPGALMRAFAVAQLAPGVTPPPPPADPPPPWMAKRPAGVRAFVRAFEGSDLSVEDLRSFDGPVWYALGGRSNPEVYARMAERLTTIWPRMVVDLFPERHHFDPPHRAEPARVAAALEALWADDHR